MFAPAKDPEDRRWSWAARSAVSLWVVDGTLIATNGDGVFRLWRGAGDARYKDGRYNSHGGTLNGQPIGVGDMAIVQSYHKWDDGTSRPLKGDVINRRKLTSRVEDDGNVVLIHHYDDTAPVIPCHVWESLLYAVEPDTMLAFVPVSAFVLTHTMMVLFDFCDGSAIGATARRRFLV